MGTVTTKSNLQYARRTEVIDPLILSYAYGAMYLQKLVRQKDISGEPTLVAKFASWGQLTGVAKVEGTDATASANATVSDGTVTVADVIVASELPELTMEGSQGLVSEDDIAREMGLAIAAKIETDLAALFASFSTNNVGTTTVALSIANIEDGIYKLRAAKVPLNGEGVANMPPELARAINFVGDEIQIEHFARALRQANLTWTGAADMGIYRDLGSAAPSGIRGRWNGVNFYGSTFCASANTNADKVGGLFVPAALGFVTKGAPSMKAGDWIFGASSRLAARASYGAGIIKDVWGCGVTTSAT